MQSRKQNKIYVAFPGMGKTTYALSHSGVVDLDFGNFRSALRVPKEQEHTIVASYLRLAKYYYKDGYTVLTNDPSLIPGLKQLAGQNVEVVLPDNYTELVERVKQREEERHINAEFPKLLEKNVDKWIDHWVKIADRCSIPIHRVKYFEEVRK